MKNGYDYAVEMMRKYPHDEATDLEERYYDYAGEVSRLLRVKKLTGTYSVNSGARKTFRQEYEKLVDKAICMINGSAEIVFQGTYGHVLPNPDGAIRFTVDVSNIIKKLPKLQKGESYVFPTLKVDKKWGQVNFQVGKWQ